MFPYKKLFISKETILERFDNLKKYKAKYSSEPYTITNIPSLRPIDLWYYPIKIYLNIVTKESDYEKYNEISDYFTETSRVLAKRYNAKSLMEYWEQDKHKLLNLTPKEQREYLYKTYPEVNTFRPSNLVAIIKKFKPHSILDMSAGWGDCLIACLAKNVDYLGVDPNTNNDYQSVINFFSHTSKAKVICSPFEKVDLQNEKFDMMFSSPPYFNLEIYNDEASQSHHIKNWYNDFLMFSIKKIWQHLNIGGYLIMVINDGGGNKYVQRMIRDTNTFWDAKYLGVISYGTKSHQPMWIWQKIEGLKVHIKMDILQKEIIIFYKGKDLSDMCYVAKNMKKYITIFTKVVNKHILKCVMLGAKIYVTQKINKMFTNDKQYVIS